MEEMLWSIVPVHNTQERSLPAQNLKNGNKRRMRKWQRVSEFLNGTPAQNRPFSAING